MRNIFQYIARSGPFAADDEYWINVTTYNNPNDCSVTVPSEADRDRHNDKPGAKAGKSIYHGLFVHLAVEFIGKGWMTVLTEFARPQPALDGTGR